MTMRPGRTRTTASTLPPLPCACASLRRASRAVTQLYDSLLRPAGLRTTQFTLLMVLAKSGPVRQGRLGQALALDSTTLTRTLALLRRAGWIAVRRGEDQREKQVSLTPAGRKQLERAEVHWEQAQKRLHAALGDRSWRKMLAVTRRVAAAASQ
jgi:DNA-binding MarR family transcriptional regulator